MAEKQDIAMNQFPVVTDLSYVYGEKSNNQNKIAVEDLAKQMGIYTKKWDSNKGDLLEINAPYSIFIIGESVIGGHIMGVFANNITVLSKARQFSEGNMITTAFFENSIDEVLNELSSLCHLKYNKVSDRHFVFYTER